MKRILNKIVIAAGAAALLATTACGTVARTGQDFQAVHYTGGAYSKQAFGNCVVPGDRQRNGWGDVDYYYPAGERTFQFDGTDSDPIPVQTSDGQEVTVSGFITFRFTDNCDVLRKFHEDKGLKQKAYFTLADSESGGIDYTSEGWSDFLKTYFGVPTRDALNAQSSKYGWKSLYQNSEIQSNFKEESVKTLPAAINGSVGKDVVQVTSIQITPPQPNDDLKQTLVDSEKSKSAAKAEEDKARAQETAQQAKNDLAREKFNGSKECLKVYSEESCLYLELADRDKIQFIPQGSNLNVQSK